MAKTLYNWTKISDGTPESGRSIRIKYMIDGEEKVVTGYYVANDGYRRISGNNTYRVPHVIEWRYTITIK